MQNKSQLHYLSLDEELESFVRFNAIDEMFRNVAYKIDFALELSVGVKRKSWVKRFVQWAAARLSHKLVHNSQESDKATPVAIAPKQTQVAWFKQCSQESCKLVFYVHLVTFECCSQDLLKITWSFKQNHLLEIRHYWLDKRGQWKNFQQLVLSANANSNKLCKTKRHMLRGSRQVGNCTWFYIIMNGKYA